MAIGIILVLALVQGLAEFLPISSSGHLRIFSALFGLEDPQTLLDILLHVGTLAAVVWVYRTQVQAIIGGTWRALFARQGRSFQQVWQAELGFRLFCLMSLATIPTGIIAIAFGGTLEHWAVSLAFVGAALVLNAGILWLLHTRLKARRPDEGRPLEAMTVRDALLIGLTQGFAVTRGISRSGSTITAAVLLGLRQDAAATFSFLLSIPAILGALVLTLKDFEGELGSLGPAFLGAVVAGIVGIIALKVLLKMLGQGRLGLFAGYSFAVGLFAIGYHFFAA